MKADRSPTTPTEIGQPLATPVTIQNELAQTDTQPAHDDTTPKTAGKWNKRNIAHVEAPADDEDRLKTDNAPTSPDLIAPITPQLTANAVLPLSPGPDATAEQIQAHNDLVTAQGVPSSSEEEDVSMTKTAARKEKTRYIQPNLEKAQALVHPLLLPRP